MTEPSEHQLHTVPHGALPSWARLRDALLDLSRQDELDESASIARLLSISAQALGVDRVSFWRLDADRRSITREQLHCAGSEPDYQRLVLTAEQAPRYLEALDATLTLAAEDVRTDDRTQELLADYMTPLGIGAMLDVGVRHSGALVGVICHEHVGAPREWNAEERMFAAAISALAAQQLEHSERMRAETARRRALSTDQLTGLPNRSGLLDNLSRAFSGAPGALGSLVLVDIDRFHRINHVYGAETGDRVLVVCADRLRALYPEDRLARLGNDQFAIIVAQSARSAREEALRHAERARDALQVPVEWRNRRHAFSVSMGILPDLGSFASADRALRDAMIVLDTASRGPRGNLAVFDARVRETVAQRLALETDIRRGAEAGEFELHLQPILRAGDRVLIGAEALMRWRHPGRGLLAPGQFIEVAEETGLLAGIQADCLPALLRRVAAWRQRPGFARFRLGLNLAAAQLSDRMFSRQLEQACGEAGLPTDLLCLEITENTLLESVEDIEQTLVSLSDLGLTLALDDFGTGHASLRHLISLPLAAVKLDRSFVGRLGQGGRVAEIVRGMIKMAHALGLTTIAEGVETGQQLSLLEEMECDALQGYAFDPALSPERFEARWVPPAPDGERGLSTPVSGGDRQTG